MFLTPPPRVWRQITRPDLPAGRPDRTRRPTVAERLIRLIGRPAPRSECAPTVAATKPSTQTADP